MGLKLSHTKKKNYNKILFPAYVNNFILIKYSTFETAIIKTKNSDMKYATVYSLNLYKTKTI